MSTVLNAVVNLLAWAVRRQRRVRVCGQSMVPTLADGEFVLIDPARRPSVGDLVVSLHPDAAPGGAADDLWVVKRVAAFSDDGAVVLRSDNPGVGTDSRTWGPVDAASVIGTVTVVLDRLFSADLGPPGR